MHFDFYLHFWDVLMVSNCAVQIKGCLVKMLVGEKILL